MLDFNNVGPNDIDNQFVIETPTVKITGPNRPHRARSRRIALR